MKSRRKWIDPEDFVLMRCRAGLTVDAAAALLDVNVRTVRNWERGMTAIPYSAYRLLKIVNGYVFTSPAWDGWFIRGDTLYSPTQRGFKPHELVYLSNYLWMARQWLKEREARKLSRVDAARHTDRNPEKVAVPQGQAISNAPALITAPLLTGFDVALMNDDEEPATKRRREAPNLVITTLKKTDNGNPRQYSLSLNRFGADTSPLLSLSAKRPSIYTDLYTLCEVSNKLPHHWLIFRGY